MLVPSLAFPLLGQGTLGEKGACSLDGTGSPDHVFLPLKESLHWMVPSPPHRPCIYVHTQCLSLASSISHPLHRPGKEKGHAKAGLPPRGLHPPCQPGLWSLCAPNPRGPGARGRKQGLGLPYFAHQIEFLFCILFPWPLPECRSAGLGEGQIYAAIFIHSQFRAGRGRSSPPSPPHPSHPPSLRGECLHVSFAVVGDCLTEPHPHLGLQG